MVSQFQFLTPISLSANSEDIALLSGEFDVNWSIALNARPVLSGLRVLVVDDHADTRDLFTFEAEGAQVLAAASTAEALAALEQVNPDVLVSAMCHIGIASRCIGIASSRNRIASGCIGIAASSHSIALTPTKIPQQKVSLYACAARSFLLHCCDTDFFLVGRVSRTKSGLR